MLRVFFPSFFHEVPRYISNQQTSQTYHTQRSYPFYDQLRFPKSHSVTSFFLSSSSSSTATTTTSSMLLLLCFLLLHPACTYAAFDSFHFDGFESTDLTLDGLATITPSGLLALTNGTVQQQGHAFYPLPFSSASSFSTSFVFAITSEYPNRLSGHGIAFVISRTANLQNTLASQYLGLFNTTNNGNASNHLVAVEFDTIESSEFQDIDANHVGVDINSLTSNQSRTAGYYTDTSGNLTFHNISLISGNPITVSIDYTSQTNRLQVTIFPSNSPQPNHPLLTSTVNISHVVGDSIFLGFSSSTGSVISFHYILGWSFRLNGKAAKLDLANLPQVPKIDSNTKTEKDSRSVWVPTTVAVAVVLSITAVVGVMLWRNKFSDILEEWEFEYSPRLRRFRYRDLYLASRGFREKGLLGYGGFGRVYYGVLPGSKQEVAIKKVFHDESRDGIKGFVAEIASIGQLSHRNLVQLLGYCRRKREMLLVYEFMPNGSLDKHVFFNGEKKDGDVIDWSTRFGIIRGVAAGLAYLHEGWEKVVIHRDIKASNVLLDEDMNARLGDFGLARLHERGSNLGTTMVMGTMGYLAPDFSRTGRATTKTDVFAFGAFLLEVVCGRRPIESEVVLVELVMESWKKGHLMEVVDVRMEGLYEVEEVEMVLVVGLLCSNVVPELRPAMRDVVRLLEGEMPLPEIPDGCFNVGILEAMGKDLIFGSRKAATSSLFSVETFASESGCSAADV